MTVDIYIHFTGVVPNRIYGTTSLYSADLSIQSSSPLPFNLVFFLFWFLDRLSSGQIPFLQPVSVWSHTWSSFVFHFFNCAFSSLMAYWFGLCPFDRSIFFGTRPRFEDIFCHTILSHLHPHDVSPYFVTLLDLAEKKVVDFYFYRARMFSRQWK